MSVHWPGSEPSQSPMMRASNADRERAADVLKAGFAEGRLTKEEYDQRLARVHEALTYGDLQPLVGDLPQGPVPAAPPAQYRPPAVPRAFRPAGALPPVNGFATGSLVCGILSPVSWGMTAIPAVVLGHKARAEIRRSGERGDGLAVAGLVVGYLTIGLGLLLFLVFGMAVVVA